MKRIDTSTFLCYVRDTKSYYGTIDMEFTRKRFEEDVNDIIKRLSSAGYEIVDHCGRVIKGFIAVIVEPGAAFGYDVAYRFEF